MKNTTRILDDENEIENLDAYYHLSNPWNYTLFPETTFLTLDVHIEVKAGRKERAGNHCQSIEAAIADHVWFQFLTSFSSKEILVPWLPKQFLAQEFVHINILSHFMHKKGKETILKVSSELVSKKKMPKN